LRREKGVVTILHRGNQRELTKGEKEVRNGRGRKEQSQYTTGATKG
jgi:hypothetical protein